MGAKLKYLNKKLSKDIFHKFYLLILFLSGTFSLLFFQNCSKIKVNQPTAIQLSSQSETPPLQDENSDATVLSQTKPIPGECGENFQTTLAQVITKPSQGLCKKSNASKSVVVNFNNTSKIFQWTCFGSDGGIDVSCSVKQVSAGSGECKNPLPENPTSTSVASQLCASNFGSQNFSISGVTPNRVYTWICKSDGKSGSLDANCTVKEPKTCSNTKNTIPTTRTVQCPSGSGSFNITGQPSCSGAGEWTVNFSTLNYSSCRCLNAGEVLNPVTGICSCPTGQKVVNGQCGVSSDYEFKSLNLFYGPAMNSAVNPSYSGYDGSLIEGQQATISGIQLIECRSDSPSDCRTKNINDLPANQLNWSITADRNDNNYQINSIGTIITTDSGTANPDMNLTVTATIHSGTLGFAKYAGSKSIYKVRLFKLFEPSLIANQSAFSGYGSFYVSLKINGLDSFQMTEFNHTCSAKLVDGISGSTSNLVLDESDSPKAGFSKIVLTGKNSLGATVNFYMLSAGSRLEISCTVTDSRFGKSKTAIYSETKLTAAGSNSNSGGGSVVNNNDGICNPDISSTESYKSISYNKQTIWSAALCKQGTVDISSFKEIKNTSLHYRNSNNSEVYASEGYAFEWACTGLSGGANSKTCKAIMSCREYLKTGSPGFGDNSNFLDLYAHTWPDVDQASRANHATEQQRYQYLQNHVNLMINTNGHEGRCGD